MGLPLDNAFQRLGCEGVSRRVKCDSDSTAIRMVINLVGTGATIERKTVTHQRGDNLASSQAA